MGSPPTKQGMPNGSSLSVADARDEGSSVVPLHGRESESQPVAMKSDERTPDFEAMAVGGGNEDSQESFDDSELTTESTERKPRSVQYINSILEKKYDDSRLEAVIQNEIEFIIDAHEALKDFEVIFLYDYNHINKTHASSIYQHLASMPKKRDILLVLKSPGGEVEPAYLISKMCNRLKLSKFIIGIPAEAKSAATLLSLGADELHMGGMSELGPIDPQINDFPALAFSSALEKIAQIAQMYPGAADMLAKYLVDSELDVRALGLYDRITESSAHYAQRLLQAKATAADEDGIDQIQYLSDHFTNNYKDHNFVIDIDEAQELLTEDVVKSETDIYAACHEVHKFLETFETAMLIKGMKRRIVGMGRSFYISRTK